MNLYSKNWMLRNSKHRLAIAMHNFSLANYGGNAIRSINKNRNSVRTAYTDLTTFYEFCNRKLNVSNYISALFDSLANMTIHHGECNVSICERAENARATILFAGKDKNSHENHYTKF